MLGGAGFHSSTVCTYMYVCLEEDQDAILFSLDFPC